MNKQADDEKEQAHVETAPAETTTVPSPTATVKSPPGRTATSPPPQAHKHPKFTSLPRTPQPSLLREQQPSGKVSVRRSTVPP